MKASFSASAHPLPRPKKLVEKNDRAVKSDLSLHFSTFHGISLNFSVFLYISIHFSTFLCISLHFSAFLSIYLHFSAFYIFGQFDGAYCRPMDAIFPLGPVEVVEIFVIETSVNDHE